MFANIYLYEKLIFEIYIYCITNKQRNFIISN